MAFAHVAGVAANVPAFFVVLEAFLAGRGWILVAGGGTTSIKYRTTGELGTFNMLYTQIRRDGGNPERIYFRVQDDAAGTHTTTEYYMVTPGGGAVAFNYWISGNKDCVIIVIKEGVSYDGCYIGTVEPFALSVADERYRHVTFSFNAMTARVLRRYSGAYDYATTVRGMMTTSDPTTLDGSRTLLGCYVLGASYSEIYGQPFYVTNSMGSLGFNSQDTITSGYPAATSDWIAFVLDTKVVCIMTGGVLPLGIPESPGYTVQTGSFADRDDIFATIRAFAVALGWTDSDFYSTPLQNRYLTSPGESGVDDIRCLLNVSSSATPWVEFSSIDFNGGGFHEAGAIFSSSIGAGEFPLPYILFGDLDCIGLAGLMNGYYTIVWMGKLNTTYPDETIIPHEYLQGAAKIGGFPCSTEYQCLRDRNGTWSAGLTAIEFTDAYTNSSPNLIDGVTYVLWPVGQMLDAVAPYWIFGIHKYIYRLSGTALSVGDTVMIGGQVFQYLQNGYALRIA